MEDILDEGVEDDCQQDGVLEPENELKSAG